MRWTLELMNGNWGTRKLLLQSLLISIYQRKRDQPSISNSSPFSFSSPRLSPFFLCDWRHIHRISSGTTTFDRKITHTETKMLSSYFFSPSSKFSFCQVFFFACSTSIHQTILSRSKFNAVLHSINFDHSRLRRIARAPRYAARNQNTCSERSKVSRSVRSLVPKKIPICTFKNATIYVCLTHVPCNDRERIFATQKTHRKLQFNHQKILMRKGRTTTTRSEWIISDWFDE